MEAQSEQHNPYDSIPTDLRHLPNWVVWRLEQRDGEPKPRKVPYAPVTHRAAKANDATTWGTFEQAVAACRQGQYHGVGFEFRQTDGLVFVDLDGCLDAAEQPNQFAQSVLASLPSYTEVSQSGKGLHIIVRGEKPGNNCKQQRLGFEMYSHARFCAMTGDVYQDRRDVADCRDGLKRVYEAVWPRTVIRQARTAARERTEDIANEDVLEKARAANDGDTFNRLYAGEWEGEYPSQSEADLALCAMLLRASEGDVEQADELFQQSGLYRDKWHETRGDLTYGEMTLRYARNSYQPPRQTPKQTQVVLHARAWLTSTETEQERAKRLREVARAAGRETVRTPKSLREAAVVRVIAQPPGTGKTYEVAELGRPTWKHPQGKHNIGLIVERKSQTEQVNFNGWHVQEGCNADNCPDGWQLHQTLALLGYNTAGVHKAHNCRYWQQMERAGSTVYQVEHVGTAYVNREGNVHGLFVIDEFNLPKWIPAHYFTINTLVAATAKYEPGSGEYILLEAVRQVVVTATSTMQGKMLFDAIDSWCGGQLAHVVMRLDGRDKEMHERPFADAETVSDAQALPPVVVPKLVRALFSEMGKWLDGGDWNSQMRVTRHDNGWALCISERRLLPSGRQVRVQDATADETILSQFFERPVRIVRSGIEPMAGTRHIWARGARFGKTDLTESGNRAEVQRRAVSRIRYLLKTYCHDGATVGVITFKSLLEHVTAALGIPAERSLNFWGQRGSNALADVDVLIVLGTPAWNPEDVYRMTRVLYANDAVPLVEGFEMGRYADNRCQQVANHLTRSEVTQAVHRSRVLRYAGRTVITLTNVEVDYLPVTHEITQFAALADDGTPLQEARANHRENNLVEAAKRLEAQGVRLTAALLAREARVRKSVAIDWLRRWRGGASEVG